MCPARGAVTIAGMSSATPLFVCGLLSMLAAQDPGSGGAVAGAPSAPRHECREVADVPYLTGDGAHATKHKLDLFLPRLPDGAAKPPLVMFVHGGAWRSGDRARYGELGLTFAGRGVACAVISYRLSPAVTHPAHVEDVAAAFHWVAGHADEHGYDRAKVFLCGHSAGAHLVALLATDARYLAVHGLTPKDIRGVVPISGPFDVSADMPLLVTAFGGDAEVRRDASPMQHVTKDAPPFLVLWADGDMTGLPLSGRTFAAALRRAGANATSAEIADRTHASIMTRFGRSGDRTAESIFEFVAAATQSASEPANAGPAERTQR